MIRGTLAAFALALVLAAPTAAAQQYNVSFHAFPLPNGGVTSGTWTSPWFATAFGFSELVASWNASTPAGSWIEVRMRATTDKGTPTKWYVMGRWAYGDGDIQRTSVGSQGDADGFVSIDTFFAKDHPLSAYQLSVTLYGTGAKVTRLGAVASDPVNTNPYVSSATRDRSRRRGSRCRRSPGRGLDWRNAAALGAPFVRMWTLRLLL